jgi:hypothetical protein
VAAGTTDIGGVVTGLNGPEGIGKLLSEKASSVA